MLSTTIKSTTTTCYLKAAYSISLCNKLLDPLSYTGSLDAHCIKEVLSEVKRWECMPNRRKSVTIKIVLHMHKKCKNKHSDRPDSVLCDWIVLVMGTKCLRQDTAPHRPRRLTTGFNFPDLIFLGVDRTTIPSNGPRKFMAPTLNSSSSDREHTTP